MALTAAGRAFAERVRSSLDELSAAAESLRARREDRLTVSVLPSFASRWLMPRLIRFMEAHPQIEVSVVATTALANFTTDEVDIGIRFGPKEALDRIARAEVVDPSLIYFRSMPRFETGAAKYRWLMEHLFVGSGARTGTMAAPTGTMRQALADAKTALAAIEKEIK